LRDTDELMKKLEGEVNGGGHRKKFALFYYLAEME
jgi:hypothetical protein